MSTNLATGKPKKHKQLSDMMEYVFNNHQGIGEKDENQELINIVI